MKQKIIVATIIATLLTGCATTLQPRTADTIELARIAKDSIGVASIDELEISNVQTLPSDSTGDTHYRYNVVTARKKKFICDVVLVPIVKPSLLFPAPPQQPRSDTAKCNAR